MSHIDVRRLVGDKSSFAGHKWWYHFHSLPAIFKGNNVGKYVGQLARNYSKLTLNWNDDLNSEWISRHFLATKMILSSSVMLQSLEYAEDKNLRVAVSYLEYYSILMALRAMLFCTPAIGWNKGEMIRLDHKRTLNVAGDILSKLNKELAKKILRYMFHLKAYRELISYRAPSSGDSFEKVTCPIHIIFRNSVKSSSSLRSCILRCWNDRLKRTLTVTLHLRMNILSRFLVRS